MITAYICSPYRAKTKEDLKRNKKYAKMLTRTAIDSGIAPITPHLYITKVTNDDKTEEREAGLRAGLELLLRCDVVLAGIKYGYSEGMREEIKLAHRKGIPVIEYEAFNNADDFIEGIKREAYKNKKAYFI